MKFIVIAIVMGVVLLVYGYLFSTAGHDHSSHSQGTNMPADNAMKHESEPEHDHGEHSHR